jgi:hypothetical protein
MIYHTKKEELYEQRTTQETETNKGTSRNT